MELSDERKKRIREEEEAKLRAEREAEEQYREQVRRELEEQQHAELEQHYRESVRAELSGDLPDQETPADIPPPVPTPTPEPKPARQRRLRFPARVVAFALIAGGIACAGLSFSRGFALPFIGPPGELTLKMGSPGELEAVDEVFYSTETVSAPAKVAETTAPSRVTSAAETPKEPTPTPAPAAKPSGAKRVTLRGTNTSVEVPAGWVVESADADEVIEIRWHGSGVASGRQEIVAYLLLQSVDLRKGEDVDDFADRMMDEFDASVAPDQDIAYENEAVIKNFHGVTAYAIDIVERGFLPYRMRNFFWIKGGKAYMMSCYATAGSFEERLPAFTRMIESLRFSKEGR